MQVGEVIFEKSLKNLKKIQNRLNSTNLNNLIKIKQEEVLFLAIGGYNRTDELLKEMGVKSSEISTHTNLKLSASFLQETHGKKIVLIKKINYLTSVNKNLGSTIKKLDLNVADSFEEHMMQYRSASRMVVIDRKLVPWQKPGIVVLDDPSLNLQFDGHRFNYAVEVGFVQVRTRSANPKAILEELEDVEESSKMQFALYQHNEVDEEEVVAALGRLFSKGSREKDGERYYKPVEFKQIVGSNELAKAIKEINQLKIKQLKSNKKFKSENARWIIVPEEAFEFKGFDYKDSEDLFEEELKKEMDAEQEIEKRRQKALDKILEVDFPINVQTGYNKSTFNHVPSQTLKSFLEEVDRVEQEKVQGIELLNAAQTEDDYKQIKKHNLAYFLDGTYKDNTRKDANYIGGKRLISIDIDDADYTISELENKLEEQGLFGIIYRTAKFYFDQSNRWRIILMADKEMDKESYKHTVAGVAEMLELEIDEASKKLSQLMGYPLSTEDTVTVVGSMVSVDQFKPKETIKPQRTFSNVVNINSNKSIMDFDHSQAKLLKQAIQGGGIGEGSRNETYRQIYLYLKDTIANPSLSNWHDEAYDLIEQTQAQAIADGLSEEEVEVIYREELHQGTN